MSKSEILERWTEYIMDFLEDDRPELPRIYKEITGPNIIASEVGCAISKLKRYKASGSDNILKKDVSLLV